jgi:ABC-type maltose transport system permease subunit
VSYNLLMAASTLIVLPVVALFIAFQRFFIEGVTVGSVKG